MKPPAPTPIPAKPLRLAAAADETAPQALRLIVSGTVQGVGFRPFVARLARRLGLAGSVANAAGRVIIELQGSPAQVAAFRHALHTEHPAPARITQISASALPYRARSGFEICASPPGQEGAPCLLPDSVTCPSCLAELNDAANRRYRYPFISCAECGPRFSITERQPFDREATTLRDFPLCAACLAEYRDPSNRRYHAQTIGCAACGPRLALATAKGVVSLHGEAALAAAIDRLQHGEILALQGIGGFQLVVDAGNAAAVSRLRQRKARAAKPFALMVADLSAAARCVVLDAAARALLCSAAGPIVLLPRCDRDIAATVAPATPYLGLMLPSSGLHALLLAGFGGALVVTSGNLAGAPIACSHDEALAALGEIADAFLWHPRRISARLDDSVAQIVAGQPQLLRRARGYVPLTLPLAAAPGPGPHTLLALGAQQKNAAALGWDSAAVLSPYHGDLDSLAARAQLARSTEALLALLPSAPAALVVDAHRDYASTAYGLELAQQLQRPVLRVWHHLAHLHACIAEHQLALPVLGLAWDGSGLGAAEHGRPALQGSEVFRVSHAGCQHLAGLFPFALPGGERAAAEPRRAALGLLHTLGVAAAEMPATLCAQFSAEEWRGLQQMLARGLNCPPCSSMGRLFDGIAALLGLCSIHRFEAEAAQQLQFAAARAAPAPPYPKATASTLLDWRPLLRGVLADHASGVSVEHIAARVHATLVDLIVDQARQHALPQVVLAGGCFQNRLLLETAIAALRGAGFTPHWPQQLPPNDGGLAFGQLGAARYGHVANPDAAGA